MSFPRYRYPMIYRSVVARADKKEEKATVATSTPETNTFTLLIFTFLACDKMDFVMVLEWDLMLFCTSNSSANSTSIPLYSRIRSYVSSLLVTSLILGVNTAFTLPSCWKIVSTSMDTFLRNIQEAPQHRLEF